MHVRRCQWQHLSYHTTPSANTIVEVVYVHCVSTKGTLTLSIITLKRINKFYRFLTQMLFLTQLAIKWRFKFPPHPTSAYTLPVENRTNEICIEMNNKRQQTGD